MENLFKSNLTTTYKLLIYCSNAMCCHSLEPETSSKKIVLNKTDLTKILFSLILIQMCTHF